MYDHCLVWKYREPKSELQQKEALVSEEGTLLHLFRKHKKTCVSSLNDDDPSIVREVQLPNFHDLPLIALNM